MKSQALTLLASWVVAEPSLAVANKLHEQDLPNRILEDLVTRAHVYLPGPAAGATVQVLSALPLALPSGCLLCCLLAFKAHWQKADSRHRPGGISSAGLQHVLCRKVHAYNIHITLFMRIHITVLCTYYNCVLDATAFWLSRYLLRARVMSAFCLLSVWPLACWMSVISVDATL